MHPPAEAFSWTLARRFLLIWAISFTGHATAQSSEAIRILPLGDSITHGADQVSYRRALWFKLQNAGYNVDFVGSHTDFAGTVPPNQQDFDLDHEGHSGIEAGQIDQNLGGWLQLYELDIVLLHIGTNDINRGQSVASTLTEMSSIVSKLRAKNPEVIILVAKIIPMRTTSVTAFNDGIDSWMSSQNHPSSPIVLVDQFTGFDAFADNADNYHPNPAGEEKMATKWFDSLQPFLVDGNEPPVAEAGSATQVANSGVPANLLGSASDDGLPGGTSLSVTWSLQSGPGTVTFSNVNDATTTATFSISGNYVLKLTATDTQYARSDTVPVIVNSTSGGAISPSVPGITRFWQLDENGGSTTVDSSGSTSTSGTGTLIALTNSAWQPGNYNSGLCLNGSANQEVSIPNAGSALMTPSVTVAGWANINAPLSTWAWIAAQGDNYGLFVDASGVTFYFYNGSTWRSVRFNTNAVSDNQWHHFAGSFNEATGILSVYVDGTLVNSAYYSESIAHTRGSDFSIGSTQGRRNFNGCLDEIQVYGRALDDSEVMTLSQPGTTPSNTPPSVNAGSNQTIQLPTNSVQLTSALIDDGLPSSPLSFSWVQISGPNSATVVPGTLNGSALNTDLTGLIEGTYVFRLSASDGVLSSNDDTQVLVLGTNTATNTPPSVNAGSDQTIQLPTNSVQLTSALIDDGLPSSPLSFSWVQISGPNSATVVPGTLNGSALNTDLTGLIEGTYVFRLSASDGVLSDNDDVQVSVQANTTPPSGVSPSLSGIAGFWQLDEDTGIQAADSSGAGIDGSLIALTNSAWQPGNYNSGLCLNGSANQEVSIPNAGSALMTPSVTVAGWANINAPLSTWAWIAAQGDNYGLFVDASGVTFYFYNGSTWRSVRFNTNAVSDNQWHHFAGSFNEATGILSVYVDGTLVNSAYYSESIAHTRGSDFSIGSTQGRRNFNGCLDEIQVYGRALDDSEVMTLSQPGTTPSNTPPSVNAGSNQTIQLPTNSVQLTSALIDDGLPSSPLSFSWVQISGPNSATVVPGTLNGSALNTDLTGLIEGTYVFRLSASDGVLSDNDDVQVSVQANTTPPSGVSPSLSGIAGFWQLDEDTGIQAADSSGAGIDGSLIALTNSAWQPGNYNSGLCLNGSANQEVSIPNAGSALMTPSVTVAGWANINAPLSTWAWIAAQGDNYGLFVDASGVTFYFYNGSTWRSVRFNTNAVSDNQWHHFAGSFNEATGILSVYVDGTLVNSAYYSESIAHTRGSDFSIGSTQGRRNFNGCLDEIQVYGRALDDSEVMTLAQ